MLSVQDLSIARGGIAVLEGVNFAVAKGEALILRGPNGCGKTTLLRTIAGLQPALAGQVVVDADTLAYASHADGLKPTLTVTENLQFWAEVFGTGADAVAPALEAMDIAALAERPAQNLSAGQKRRLGLARMRVTGRAIWIFDEPTVSLDLASVALFSAMVRAHLAQGGAAVMATHIDLGLIEAQVLELTPFRAKAPTQGGRIGDFDEAFE